MAKMCKRLKKSALPEKECALEEALAAVAGGSGVKFDETVDIAVQLGVDTKKSDQAVRGAVTLPAGSGKTVRVGVVATGKAAEAAAAAGADKTGFEDFIEEIKKGVLDFDVLIAAPDVMHKLAAAGKILGPRGLMPNPKTGTVTADTGAAVKNAKTGQARFRADKSGIVHAPVGKASFSPEALKQNAESVIAALKRAKPASSKGIYLRKMSVSCTMGRAVAVDISPYR
ncbi:MAG: 50S ribosomal protein L1 [Gammaproteobacteria bacterium]